MWPWREKIETRTAQPFTDAIAAAIIAQASGTVPSNPLTLAALEMASGAYSRAFMGATVEGSAMVKKKALTSGTLGLIARDLIRRGESIHLILTDTGTLELIPCGSWMFGGNGQKIPGNIGLTCSDLRETSPALCLHLLLSIADILMIRRAPGLESVP